MIIPEGFAQLSIRFTGNAVPEGAVCTLGLNVVFYGGTPAGLAEGFYTFYKDNVLPHQGGLIQLDEVEAKFGPNDTGPSGVYVDDEKGAVGPVLAPNVAYLIKKITTQGGRKQRGRMYLPAVLEAECGDNGTLSGAIRDDLDEGWATIIAAYNAVGVPLALLHADEATEPTQITQMVTDFKVATQRRRLRR